MNDKLRIAVDAMGGDNAPDEIVKGVIDAVGKCADIHVFLVGKQDVVKAVLDRYGYSGDGISAVNADEVIDPDEPPVIAIRSKKNSSIVVGMMMVRRGEADAFISAGSSGAILVGGQVIVGRSKGVERPPLAPLIPTKTGVSILVDCGANVDAKPTNLLQFAQMGSIYMEHVVGIPNPKVAIVNIGVEEEKGNALVKETFPLLKACPNINFIGSIEARDIPAGIADVIVCDAFVGNVILKFYEGSAAVILSKIKEGMMSSFRSKIGALLVKPGLKKALSGFHADEYGGAPLLGLKGLVVKAHGSSKAREISIAIQQCITFHNQKINERISEYLNSPDSSASSQQAGGSARDGK